MGFECICVDDGSTDASAAIAQEFCARDARFRLIRQQNRGPSVARNRGIEESRCQYVTFLDSDDYLHPQAFELLLAMAVSSEADLVCCGSMRVPESATLPVIPAHLEHMNADLVTAEPLLSVLRGLAPVGPSVCAKLYSVSLLERCRFDESLRIHEDTFYSIQALRRAIRLAYSAVPIYFYGTRPGSLTTSKTYEASLKNLVGAAVQSKDLAIELGLWGKEESALLMLGGVEAFSMIAVELALDRGLRIKEKQRLLKVCASLVSQLRSENILARVNLPGFLSWSICIAYGMRMPRVYASAYHGLIALRDVLRRMVRGTSRTAA